MEVLNSDLALSYQGGGKIGITVAAIIGGTVAFILGLIEGITNPKTCNVKR